MADPIYVGQTFRATASALVDAAGVTLISPVVTISLEGPDDLSTAGSVVQSGLTYHAEFMATQKGIHHVTVTAVAGGGTWIGKTKVIISA